MKYNIMFLNSIKRYILIATKFLEGLIDGDDFKFAFYDIYYKEIKKYKFYNKEEENIFCEFENFNEKISYYCSIPELRISENLLIDEHKLAGYTKDFIEILNKYLIRHGQKNIALLKPKNLSNETINQLDNLILMINRFFSFHIEKKEVIEAIDRILVKINPNTVVEHEIKKIITNCLKKLEDLYNHGKQPNWLISWLLKNYPTLYINLFPTKDDPAKKIDPFIMTINKLEEKLYRYLNPDIPK